MTEKPSEQREGRTAEMSQCPLCGEGAPADEAKKLEHKLADFALSERLKGMEEACKILCGSCRDCTPVEMNGGVMDHVSKGRYFFTCHAAAIRKAMEVTR